MSRTTGRSPELDAAVALSRLPGVGARRFIDLIRQFRHPAVALTAWQTTEEYREIFNSPRSRKRPGPVDGWAAAARRARATARWAGGPGYPERLLDLTEPPPVVFLRGAWETAGVLRVCIVGARRATPYAERRLRAILETLEAMPAGESWPCEILSGAAAGIDGAAHRAALELGLRTSAVLACGIDVRYPACNAALIDRVAKSGGLMSELLPGTPPRRGFFPTRNRLLAALADLVLVVQAAEGSGSLITADWARKLGRPVFTLVPPDDAPEWHGNRLLLAAGARPVREPADVSAALRERRTS
ncbi:MAG TPA: DNA-processing protein DprA [Candidatus Ozemobacteraceae bacterium]|nr:DNA-processing protein DprA [Candidatus Ozemobacteraceae bacterium]